MLIRIEGSEEPGIVTEAEPGQPFFAGDLRALSVADVLAFVNTGRKSGRLIFQLSEGVRKSLYLVDGEVSFAASNAPEDRIGEVLWRSDVISKEQLQEAAAAIRPGIRIGEILMNAGVVTAADLYRGLVRQVRDIVLTLFSFSEGSFLFITSENDEIDQVQLEETTHELILAGLRAQDDLERLRTTVPLHFVYELRGAPTGMQLTLHEQAVSNLVNGIRTAAEIIQESQLGENEGLKILHNLVEARLLAPRNAAAAAAARLDAGAIPAHDARSTEGPAAISGDLFDCAGALFAAEEDWLGEAERSVGSQPLEMGGDTSQPKTGHEQSAADGQSHDAAEMVGLEQMLESDSRPSRNGEERVAPAPAPKAAPAPAPAAKEAPAPAPAAKAAPAPAPAAKAAPAPAPAPKEAPAPAPMVEPRSVEEDSEAGRMPFAAYSKVAGRIHSILGKARKNPEALNSYFENPPQVYAPLFEGVRFVGGRIDMTRLLSNAREHCGDQYKGRALEALEAFQTFALFQAKNALPPDIARKVLRLVMLIHLGKA